MLYTILWQKKPSVGNNFKKWKSYMMEIFGDTTFSPNRVTFWFYANAQQFISKNDVFDFFRRILHMKTRNCRKKYIRLWARAKHTVSIRLQLFINSHNNEWIAAGMPKSRNWRTFFQKMLFIMPAAIHLFKCLSIKSRGLLETAWIALAHSLIHIFCKALFSCKKCVWKCQKFIFLNESHVWHAGMQLRNANLELDETEHFTIYCWASV
jgi:hypothetical protein